MHLQLPAKGLQGRLDRAMKLRNLNPYSLHKEVSRRFPEVRGVSPGGVRQYVTSPPARPRLELLDAFAAVLDVRFEWLAYGQGAMTQEGQDGTDGAVEVIRLGGKAERVPSHREPVVRAMAKALGLESPPPGASAPTWLPGAMVLWGHRCARLVSLTGGEGKEAEAVRRRLSPEQTLEERVFSPSPRHLAAAEDVGKALAAPLKALGIDPATLEETTLAHYTLSAAGALAPVVQRYPKSEWLRRILEDALNESSEPEEEA